MSLHNIVCGSRLEFVTDCGKVVEERGIEKFPAFLAPGVAGEVALSG
jgi:hypothetical protein